MVASSERLHETYPIGMTATVRPRHGDGGTPVVQMRSKSAIGCLRKSELLPESMVVKGRSLETLLAFVVFCGLALALPTNLLFKKR